MGSVPDERHLAARASIRYAVLRRFAERGHDAASVRRARSAAGVSPGLVAPSRDPRS